jgi:hypothetical protein
MSNMETDLRELFAERVSSLDVSSDMPVATERRVKTRRSIVVAGAAACLLIAVAAALSWGDVFDTSSPVKPAGREPAEVLSEGLLQPGTYRASEFAQPFDFTVDDRDIGAGLSVFGDPSRQDGNETLDVDERLFVLRDGLDQSRLIIVEPFDVATQDGAEDLDIEETTFQGLADWFAAHPILESTDTSVTSIGGRPAIRVDADVQELNRTCGCVTWHEAFRSGSQLLWYDGMKERIYVVDSAEGPLVFLIEAPRELFDGFAARAEAILATIHFN